MCQDSGFVTNIKKGERSHFVRKYSESALHQSGLFKAQDITAKSMHSLAMWKSTYQVGACERRQARLQRLSAAQRASITMEEVLRS